MRIGVRSNLVFISRIVLCLDDQYSVEYLHKNRAKGMHLVDSTVRLEMAGRRQGGTEKKKVELANHVTEEVPDKFTINSSVIFHEG